MHRLLAVPCGLFAALCSASAAEFTIEPPGFLPRGPDFHALVGARVIPAPGQVLTQATVVVRAGRIEALLTDKSPPPEARRWDLQGHTIYAGFLEPYLMNRGNPGPPASPESLAAAQNQEVHPSWTSAAAGGPRFYGVPGSEADPGIPGPGAAFETVTPERRMAALYTPDASWVESLRELGFAAAQVVPDQGIIRGQAAVVLLGNEGPNASILRADTAQCLAFEPSSGGRGPGMAYPGSLMGVVALIRQTYLDADHHAADQRHAASHPRERGRPPLNLALDALMATRRGQPVIVDAGSVLMTDRAHRIAVELGLGTRVYVATGQEWMRPDLVRGVEGAFIVPVAFPALPQMPRDDDWEDVSLDQLRTWDWAPENPALLRRLGKDVALTTDRLTDRKEFRRQLRAAVDRGLTEDDALAALTVVPARIAGVEDRLGTLEPGKLANLTVVEGSYFDPAAAVRAVWVEGVPHLLPPPPRSRRTAGSADAAKAGDDASRQREETETARRQRVAAEPGRDRGVLDEPPAVLVTNATVWTCGPEGVLEGASLWVRDGRIQGVGKVPPEVGDARVIDGTGLHVTPGLIDCHNHSMILGDVNEGTLPSTAMVRVGDVVHSESPHLRYQLAGGLTVANLLHGSANPIGGQNCVIKLRDGAAPEDLKFAGAPEGIKFALGENVKQSNWGERATNRFPQSRMGVPTFFVNRFTAARQYAAARQRARDDTTGAVPPVRRDLELEALAEILDGTRLIHCHSYRQDEIVAFLRTMESFGVRVATLQHILEGYKVADEIARHGAGASAFSDWWGYKFEVLDAIPYAGSLMRERGVEVSFNSDSSDEARRLNLEAAKAVKYGGTPPAEALKFVTLHPARQLGIGRRVGSLEAGKDADFVLWSGDPLDTRSVCLQTWIDGRKYFDRAREAERARARTAERQALLAKARKLAEGGAGRDDGEAARARFFQRALEHARHLGVMDCQTCLLP